MYYEVRREVFVVMMVVVLGCATQETPKKSFSCEGRSWGYYADVTTGCQVYHMCDGLGRQFSYRCPKDTLFQQRMLICDHWYMVNCSKAEQDYSANLLIGQKGIPFVADYNQYHRTPRPDLVDPANAKNKSYNPTQAPSEPSPNIVGDDDHNLNTATNDSKYFPPSHWSTEYAKDSITQSPVPNNYDSRISQSSQSFYRTSYNTIKRLSDNQSRVKSGKRLDLNSPNHNNDFSADTKPNERKGVNTPQPPIISDVPAADRIDLSSERKVNFPSKFRATTPVYPKTVDADLTKFSGDEEQLPFEEEPVEKVQIFRSNFKATTPVYPLTVEATSPAPHSAGLLPPLIHGSDQQNPTNTYHVNFNSNFKATTPDYPKFVESTSPNPNEIGLVPPKSQDNDTQLSNDTQSRTDNIPLEVLPPKVETGIRYDFPINQPSKVHPEITLAGEDVEQSILKNTFNSKQLNDYMLSMKPEELKGLREMWHIPDYDFPLESVSGRGYGSIQSSFHANGENR
ncbi:uncharacterized protein LOC132700579 [Cylas formicarius]|uniref:uncharacterized protein LOC132700579 n=1 Tax=Cylas formicarius TaxID=197179 RepID=UPI0029589CAF|nr:uncharacterized protein LOC132700579 [Cylas formicarius]